MARRTIQDIIIKKKRDEGVSSRIKDYLPESMHHQKDFERKPSILDVTREEILREEKSPRKKSEADVATDSYFALQTNASLDGETRGPVVRGKIPVTPPSNVHDEDFRDFAKEIDSAPPNKKDTFRSELFSSKETTAKTPLFRQQAAPTRRESYRLDDQKFTAEGSFDDFLKTPKGRPGKLFYVLLGLSALLGCIYVFSLFYSGVTAELTIHEEKVGLSDTFTAQNDVGTSSIPFQIQIIKKQSSKKLAAKETHHVDRKATGTVVIYNAFDAKPQKLIKNTRLATSDGKIFRINTTVTVPGMTGSGSTKAPGSVQVDVIADTSGSDYNIPASDFKIPGFKGTPRYDGFYAKSKTAMVGGYSGDEPVVAQADVTAGLSELQNNLRAELAIEVRKAVGTDSVMYDDGILFSYTSNKDTIGQNGNTELDVEGTVYGIVFKKVDLGKAVAQKKISGYEGQDVSLVNADTLTFALSGKDVIIPSPSLRTFTFSLTGNANLRYVLAVQKLRNELRGKSKDEFQKVISGYKIVDKARLILTPFWLQTMPDDISRISVSITNDKSAK